MKTKNKLNINFLRSFASRKFIRNLFGLLLVSVLAFTFCSKRNDTKFSNNLANDQDNPISQDEFIRLMGPEKYAEYVAAIGADNLNRLTFAIGNSNTIELVNLIADTNRLTALMSGTNALTGGEVADLLITIDNQVGATGAVYDDTLLKIANLINNVNDMQWMKDLVKGAEANAFSIPNLTPMQRLGRLIAGVNENMSTMPTLLNEVAPTSGGLARLLKLINQVHNPNNLSAIINDVQTTSSIQNLTTIIKDLSMDDACSNPLLQTSQRCVLGAGTWGVGSPDATDVLIRVINEGGVCSNASFYSEYGCLDNGHSWTSRATDLADVVNTLTQVANLNDILNYLTYDDKSPGEPGDVMTGTDALIATLKNVSDISKLTQVINEIDGQVIDNSNDDDFESAAAQCGTSTRTELTKFRYGVKPMASGPNVGQNSFFVNSAAGSIGACAAQSDPTLSHNEIAAFEYTANITTAGPMSFRYRVSSEAPSALKNIQILTGGNGYTSAPTISIVGGGGSGATAVAEVATGAVGSVNLTNAGSGYTSNPGVSLTGGGGSGAVVQAQRIPVGITSVNLTNGGSYTSPPSVSLNGGGSGGAVNVVIPTAAVNGVTLTNTGSGYTSQPTCAISGGGGSGATCSAPLTQRVNTITVNTDGGCATSAISCSISGGGGSGASCTVNTTTSGCSCSGWGCTTPWRIASITVNDGGSGYSSAPAVTLSRGTATANMANDGGVRLVLNNGGSGYISPPELAIYGGGGGGAAGTTSLPARAISGLVLANPGSYTSAPVVEFIGGAGGGATANATVPASALQSLTITNGGSGYITNPTLTISGGGGSGATGTASVIPMSVTKITLTNAGSGYTSVPTVNITGGGGTGATAVASISGDYFKFYIDDVLRHVAYGNSGWLTYNSPALTTGIHRFRWEYVKDSANDSGEDRVLVDNIILPGNRGGLRQPSEKVAILMNKLFITSIENIADVLNGLTPTGISNLAQTINRVEYPNDVNEMPKLVDIVNQLDDVTILNDLLNNLNDNGMRNLVEMVDAVQSRPKLSGLVKNLTGGNPGLKMSQILNPMNSQGTNALVKVIDGMAASDPINSNDQIWQLIVLINEVNSTALFPALLGELSITGRQSTTIGTSAAPTGGGKLASVINAVRAKSVITGDAATCDSNPDSFCVKNHLVRLVDDLDSYGVGAATVGKIVTGVDQDAVGLTGPERIAEVLYALKEQGTAYTNPLSNATGDDFGRLTNLIADMGVQGAGNIVKLVNELEVSYLNGRLAYLVKNSNRMRYLARMMTELTNIDLVLLLLNNSSTNVIKVTDLINRQGNLTYGTSSIGSFGGPFYPTTSDCGLNTSTADKHGRLLCLINEISGAGTNNIVQIINTVYDLNFMSSPTATFSYGSKSDGNGYGLINAVTRIRYLTDLMNNVTNIALFLNAVNGQSGNMSDGATYTNLLLTLNNIGGSTRKGTLTKAVGDMSILAGAVNELGYNPSCPCNRSISDQMRIVRLINEVNYCGIRPQFDRDGNPGSPTSEYFPCDTHVDYAYNKSTDTYDRRHRMSNFILGMTSPRPVGIIVGNVTDTQKTINILNGFRRINTMIKAVDWMPGEVSTDLVNSTQLARISTGFVYLGNNLDPDEDIAAQAFTQMIHWGVGIPDGGARNGACTWFTAIGPKRLGGVLNTETGQYLEGILQMFGWRTAIPALVCGLGAHDAPGWGHSVSPTVYTSGTSADGTACGGNPNRCQQISGAVGTVRFKRTESVAITNNPTPGPRNGTNYTHVYQAHSKANCERYYPENSGALGFNKNTDQIVSDGFSPIWGVSVAAGIGGVWDVLKGAGIIGWLLQEGGTLGTPPVVTPPNPSCTGGGGNEWDCIKTGKDSPPNISINRWGNYCSIPGYTSPGPCESNGGRWTPNKNYPSCQLNPAVNAPIE